MCLGSSTHIHLATVVIDHLRVAYVSGEVKSLFVDMNLTGAQGVWITETDSCDQNPTSSMPTVQIFTARYSQPGHFGLLLVSQGCQGIETSHLSSL